MSEPDWLARWLEHCRQSWDALRMAESARREVERAQRINEGFGLHTPAA